ncbi:PoNe immunity protein domain-containing protein [Alloscardovia omnicolens]|uniref:PoNe immunity protein domain-containing protein n=1 Tax=Alloscardovia omnicolens TaxID=419015 RepID=UPI003A762DC5
MIRDQLKDNSYFDSFISKQYQRLSMFESRLLDNKALNEKVIKNIRYATFNISFQIIVARYSRGDSLTVIKEDYIKSIPKFKAVFSEIIDMNTLQFIALSVLLKVDLFDDKEFLVLLDKFEVSHGVIDILMGKETVTDIGEYKDIKQFRPWIAELYNKPDEREAIISKQLSNWYRSQRSSYFFGYDKEEEPLYFGYWALEIAALVKVLEIPDDSFKDHKYYPYDLVHFGG